MKFILVQERVPACIDYINKLDLKFDKYQVEIKEYKPQRSTAQNNLMWMWYSDIATVNNTTSKAMHKQCKTTFLGLKKTEVKSLFSEKTVTIVEPRSTKELKVDDMTEYLIKLEALTDFLNVTLRRPDDYLFAMGRE